MSVSLYPLNADHDHGPLNNVSNGTWKEITHRATDVPTWNGFHDGQQYTPHQLRRLAAVNPDHADWLLELADQHNGAVLC